MLDLSMHINATSTVQCDSNCLTFANLAKHDRSGISTSATSKHRHGERSNGGGQKCKMKFQFFTWAENLVTDPNCF